MTVGFLTWDHKRDVAIFEYDASFLEQGLDIAPLTMPIRSPRSQKQLPWLREKDKLHQGKLNPVARLD